MTSAQLDDWQRDVATVDRSTRQVVIAGPGAGKTHVVSALVENLVIDQGVDAVHGLLILSFSNAAVHAVDARLRQHDVPPAQVRTMDSLASRIIGELSGLDVADLTFEQRIIHATELVRQGEWDDAEDLEHLVVDEVQDIVGVRADFLLALVAALPQEAGLTLLGDPAQAIYDFQLDQQDGRGTTSAQLLEIVQGEEDVRTVVLKGQYRALTRDTKAAAGLREDGEITPHLDDIEDFRNGMVHAGEVTDIAEILDGWSGSTAFLTPTNGQALIVAGALRSAGRRVAVRRGLQQQMLAGWIARVLGNIRGASLTRDAFDELIDQGAPGTDSTAAWRSLRSVAGGRGGELDLFALASRLGSRGSLPPELIDDQGGEVVVSTVHRAKGLEFDNVVLVEFPDRGSETTPAESAGREQFVAFTRARVRIARVDGPEARWLTTMRSDSGLGSRWIRGGPKAWMTTAIEVRSGDVDFESLASQPAVRDLLPRIVGSRVDLVPSVTESSLRVPIFEVRHGDVALCTTTPSFGLDFAKRAGTLEGKRRGWPSLNGAYIEDLVTVVGDETVSRSRFHLAPALSGLASIEWSG